MIATDPATTDIDAVCDFLQTAYWAHDVSRADLVQSIRAALVYNLIDENDGAQIGFARVVTDGSRIGWLSDVYVLDAYRGRGLGKWLVGTVMADPRVAGLRRMVLATDDAHALYRQYGWSDAPPGRYMIYSKA